jgi:hypothetical protein
MNKIGIEGRFRTQIIESDGSVSFDSGENKNLITDGALDFSNFPPSGGIDLCLGSGVVTVPAVTDTNLGNQTASSAISFPNYYKDATIEATGYSCKRWGTCDLTGYNETFSEIGLKVTSPLTLITRALIKDSNGDPTTISISAAQTLRITYSLYYFYPFFISAGVTATPHGDLSWSIEHIYSAVDKRTLTNALLIAKSANNTWGWDTTYSDTLGIGSSNSVVIDIPNRKSTLTAVLSAQASDKSIVIGGEIYQASYANKYRIVATQPYTLPANYNFTLSAEISWGRMP